MIRRLSLLGALLATASCSGTTSFYGDEFSQHYKRPREETTQKRIDSKEIVYWASSPKDKKRIGFYETWLIGAKGSRTERECHFIRDAAGLHDIGFVTDEGRFYRFGPKAELLYINEYQVVTIGLKVFFGIPAHENVDLEEIDPYK